MVIFCALLQSENYVIRVTAQKLM